MKIPARLPLRGWRKPALIGAALAGSALLAWSAGPRAAPGCIDTIEDRLLRSAYREVPARAHFAAERLCERGMASRAHRTWLNPAPT